MPRLSDDGSAVTLDLHGCAVADAERLILGTARLAAERGRHRLAVIHGASTSSALYRNRTIRHTLYALLEDGTLDAWVVDDVRLDGSTLLSLAPRTSPTPERITLRDVAG